MTQGCSKSNFNGSRAKPHEKNLGMLHSGFNSFGNVLIKVMKHTDSIQHLIKSESNILLAKVSIFLVSWGRNQIYTFGDIIGLNINFSSFCLG